MSILALNAGSSSLKFGLYDDVASRELRAGVVETADLGGAVRDLLASLEPGQIRAVGHRVVHGGALFRESVLVDGTVAGALAHAADLAPLHNPPALAAIRQARESLPEAAHVAVFDTAYYADLPPRAHVYPLPWEWYTDWGIRRFGFHGISHADGAARAARRLGGDPESLRVVTLHLGNGCSATASRGGRAVATTMGFTPLEGLMMGSRSGSVDPGILVEVTRRRGITPADLDDALNHRSGLLGVSGVSSDFRRVDAAARDGNPRARLALEIYADRIRSAVALLAVSLRGLDALVFTAGVGEHQPGLRAEVCEGLELLGVKLDAEKNASARPDEDVSAEGSPARVLVLRAREELAIALEARRVAGLPGTA